MVGVTTRLKLIAPARVHKRAFGLSRRIERNNSFCAVANPLQIAYDAVLLQGQPGETDANTYLRNIYRSDKC